MRTKRVDMPLKKPSYPRLMINKQCGVIILATDDGDTKGSFDGVSVHVTSDSRYSVGQHYPNWVGFENYNGEITLSND